MASSPRLRSVSILSCLASLILLPAIADAQSSSPIDYTQRIGEGGAIAVYPVPYAVPKRDEIKAVLDRIKGYAEKSTTLKVFDNRTGKELLQPDMNNFIPTAVIDQRYGLKWATCGISALAFPSVDTAPFGFGLRPPASALGRMRNRAIGALIDATVFRPVNNDYDAMRRRLGLGPIEGGLFDD